MAKTKKKTVAACSDEELVRYIREVLNFDIKGTPSRSALLSTLEVAGVEEATMIEIDGPVVQPEEVVPKITGERGRRKGTKEDDDPNRVVTIMIAKEAGFWGQQHVHVMHNGVRIDIPRGKPVRLKQKFAWVLRDAMTRVYSQLDHELGGVDEGEDVPSYPVQYMGPAAA